MMRASATAAAVIAGVLTVSGCAGSSGRPTTGAARSQPVAKTTSKGGPGPLVIPLRPNALRNLKLHLYRPRFLSPTRLAIPGIAGSSNCPSVPAKLIVRRQHAIWLDLVLGSWSRTASGLRLRLPSAPRGGCLDDLVPTPVVVAIDPKQVDVHRRLRVSLYYPKGVSRRYRRPVVFTVPPLATARVRREVRAARASNRRFSIFPTVPGERLCAIPGAGSRRPLSGICQTRVSPYSIAQAPAVTVIFTARWDAAQARCPPMVACHPRLRHRTWRVIEGTGMPKTTTTPVIRREVQVARASDSYFSVFPAEPGAQHCAIPDGARLPKAYSGICRTSVRPRPTHEPSVSVGFTESWEPCPADAYCPATLRILHHTWQVIEGEPIIEPGAVIHIYATRSRGARPPQLRACAPSCRTPFGDRHLHRVLGAVLGLPGERLLRAAVPASRRLRITEGATSGANLRVLAMHLSGATPPERYK